MLGGIDRVADGGSKTGSSSLRVKLDLSPWNQDQKPNQNQGQKPNPNQMGAGPRYPHGEACRERIVSKITVQEAVRSNIVWTSQTTCSAGSRRVRSVAVPVGFERL